MTAHELLNKAITPVYETGVRCPACTGKSWDIRHATAECGFCAYAMPLPEQVRRDRPAIKHGKK